MSLILQQIKRLPFKPRPLIAAMYSSKDGGAGAIREGGGAFGNREKAQEAAWANKQQQEQLKKLREHLHNEISEDEAEIKRLQDKIAKQKKLRDEIQGNK